MVEIDSTVTVWSHRSSEFSMSLIQFFIACVFLAVGANATSMAAQVAASPATPSATRNADEQSPINAPFKDDVKSNAPAPKSVKELQFTNKDGSVVRLVDYLGEKNVVLVFTQGFNGMICPFCTTQTSRLVANYDKFAQRNCEVIVVYPGPDKHVGEFVKAALETEKEQVGKVPFPIVLDRDLKATNYFKINSMQAHPSTYLIDKQGRVQLAYVGTDNTADRPSIKALLGKLDAIEKQAQGK